MVVIMPKRRQWKRAVYTGVSFSVFLLIAIGVTLKMAIQSAQDNDSVTIVRRSVISPLYDLQRELWGGQQQLVENDMTTSSQLEESSTLAPTVAVSSIEGFTTTAAYSIVTEEDNAIDYDDLFARHLSICKRPNTTLRHIKSNTSHPYHDLVSITLQAVHTFVPAHYDPSFTNPCWFARMPALPEPLHKNFTEYRGCMPNVEETYDTKAAMNIVKTALKTPADGENLRKLLKNVSTSHIAASPPQCQNLANDAYLPSTSDNLSMYHSTSTNGSLLYDDCVKKHDLFCMPQVVLAGFPKCATSTMYYTMMKHPQIARSRMKEEHLWRDLFIAKQLPHRQVQTLYYIFHFERASREIFLNPDHLTVDGSTTTAFPGLYIPMHNEEDMCVLPRLMVNLIPNMRVILMMRNPIDRLYSDYWYLCAKFSWKDKRKVTVPEEYLKNGTKIFHENTVKMIDDFEECLKQKTVFECVRIAGVGYAPEVACKGPRIGLSLYYYHIIRWLNVLPKKQIYLLRTEDFLEDPHREMVGVYKFLGLSPPEKWMTQLNSKNINTWIKSAAYKKDFEMPDSTRQMLRKFFKPYNEMLSRLLKDPKYTWDDIEYAEQT